MSRVLKSIRLFLLLLAGLTVCAHMIILHDHHWADPINEQKDSCPVAEGKSGHHTRLPVHCHAFNDLAAEKKLSLDLKKYFNSGFSTIIWFPYYLENELPVSLLTVYGPLEPLPDIYFPDYSQLRGPPSLS